MRNFFSFSAFAFPIRDDVERASEQGAKSFPLLLPTSGDKSITPPSTSTPLDGNIFESQTSRLELNLNERRSFR
jgi:hypothetical protein